MQSSSSLQGPLRSWGGSGTTGAASSPPPRPIMPPPPPAEHAARARTRRTVEGRKSFFMGREERKRKLLRATAARTARASALPCTLRHADESRDSGETDEDVHNLHDHRPRAEERFNKIEV